MIKFEKDKDLSPLTTFHLPAKARLFAEYTSKEELLKISRTPEYLENEVMHIGGGSNLVMKGDFDGLILHSGIKGIISYDKDPETVYVIAGAGERWADLVDWCVDHSLEGMENMAGIPGEVGASPVQNVGAYGREAKDVIHNVELFDSFTRETVTKKASECGFAYRDSHFKHEWKGRYYVLRVSFKLRRGIKARHLGYGSLKGLEERLGHQPTIREVRDEVLAIRASKLPDPALVGSAGSYFKNPVIREGYLKAEVLRKCPETPYYELGNGMVKIPAGWMIEHAGLKGHSVGGAYVYPENCLVIANRGGATAADVLELQRQIIKKVNHEYAIVLQPEANIVSTEIDVTVLGSGTSKGVPEAGCDCDVCHSTDPHDKRRRASILVETAGMNILIDASPDLRQQAIDIDLKRIDAVLITHSHYDHVGGIDDLRPYCLNSSVPLYVKEDVDVALRKHLDYCFRESLYPGVPKFDMKVIDEYPFYLEGIRVIPIKVNHGKLPIFGYRIGKFAYVTDAKTIPEEELEKLEGLDVLILNALRDEPHFAHLNFEEAMEIIEKVKPKKVYFTHLCHHAGKHADLCKRFPDWIQPAFDGLRISIK